MIERPGRRISATTRFYAGFCIVTALVIALAFYVGYRTGIARAEHRTASTQSP